MQFFAQQMPRQGGQETQQRGRLQKSRTRRIRHQHIAGPNGLQQARHAQGGVRAQLQRVQVLIVHPLEQAVHRHQTLEGLEVQALVAHDQVAAFHQRQAQVARQVGVLKIGLVVGPGSEQRQMRLGPGRAHAFEAVHQCAVGAGQPLHAHGLKRLRKLARDGKPVFQQIAQSGRRLAALAHHPPVAIRPARQIEGRNVQMGAANRRDPMHGAQVAWMPLHQRRREQALRQQLLRPIDIGHDPLQQAHALQHAGFDLVPAVGLDDQRKQVQRPGALRPVFVRVHVVGDAVVTDLTLQRAGALVHVGHALACNIFKELSPSPRQMCVSRYRMCSNFSRGKHAGRGATAQFIEMTWRRCRSQRQRARIGLPAGVVSKRGVGRVFHVKPEYASAAPLPAPGAGDQQAGGDQNAL